MWHIGKFSILSVSLSLSVLGSINVKAAETEERQASKNKKSPIYNR